MSRPPKKRYAIAMRTLSFALLTGLAVGSWGCDDHDHTTCPTGAPEIQSLLLTPTTLAAGGDVLAKLSVLNFELSGEAHTHTEREPLNAPEAEPLDSADGDAECAGGHVHIYLDDLMTNPLTQAVTSEFTFTLPDDAAVGDHVIIGRLHNRDHTIIEPQILTEVDITVE